MGALLILVIFCKTKKINRCFRFKHAALVSSINSNDWRLFLPENMNKILKSLYISVEIVPAILWESLTSKRMNLVSYSLVEEILYCIAAYLHVSLVLYYVVMRSSFHLSSKWHIIWKREKHWRSEYKYPSQTTCAAGLDYLKTRLEILMRI